MGFYDREYAHQSGPRGGGYAGAGGAYRPSPLLGGSIVTTLIAVNVAIFILQSISPQLHQLIYGLGAMQSLAVIKGQVWRLVTAQYLHGYLGHLLFNMIALYFLGPPLAMRWSARRFFGIYTICGMAGNIFYTILGAKGVIDPTMPAVGASGSIYGLLGIVAVLFPHATVYVYFLFPLKIRTAAYIMGGIALFTVIARGNNYGGEACHLAGLLFGVWWAAYGDAWWSTTEWRFLPRRRPAAGGGGSTPTGPGAWAHHLAEERADDAAVDAILKKVYEGGIHSLTEHEKRILQSASQRQRHRDAEAGRVDRL